MSSMLTALLVLLLGVFAQQLWGFQRERSEILIDEWARREGVVLLAAERRLVATGPFSALTAPDLPVFRVRVRTPAGERRVWLRCGALIWGVLSPVVEARWDT